MFCDDLVFGVVFFEGRVYLPLLFGFESESFWDLSLVCLGVLVLFAERSAGLLDARPD